MARIRDWIDLAGSTLRSLEGRDVAGLYSLEWPEAKRVLIAEYEEEIDREPRQIFRQSRTLSALLFGLAKRLTPPRRLVFAAGGVILLLSLVSLVRVGVDLWNLVGVLASFSLMVWLLGLELIDKIKFRDELQLARELQEGLLPRELPKVPSLELHAWNRSANMVGGDLYDFVLLPDGRLAVLFGDASGHGMSAGLVMAVAQASFRTQLDLDPSPESVMAALNRILCRTGGPRSFFAAVYLLLDSDGAIEAAVAGHPPVIRVDAQGRIASRIGIGSYPLGIKPDLRWATLQEELRPDESLVFYSDGVFEARNEAGHDYGFERLEQLIGRNAHRSAAGMVGALTEDLQTFLEGRGAADDVSVAAIRRLTVVADEATTGP